jgi:hypothetical protein
MQQALFFESIYDQNQKEQRRQDLMDSGLHSQCLNHCEEFKHDADEFWCEVHNCKYYNKEFFDV